MGVVLWVKFSGKGRYFEELCVFSGAIRQSEMSQHKVHYGSSSVSQGNFIIMILYGLLIITELQPWIYQAGAGSEGRFFYNNFGLLAVEKI